ncbi:glycoside hydrolase family 26 protein [Mobilicoccus massiliensis]|uniref:glycoside hydrolase family 26 protein n=1 Tax=Mobilicoccus massiliensis TaxID=1522310 RepID=UPI00058D66C1|nr:glycosyl hydrolase [Mobilicoccus massiliensis]
MKNRSILVAALGVALALPAGFAPVESVSAQAAAMPATQPTAAPAAAFKGRPGTMARKYLGTPRSGLPWHSGAWTGEYMNARNATKWGTWRGRTSDATLTFPEWKTWKELQRSDWHVSTFNGFKGTLVYGLPMLPRNAKPAQLKDVAKGRYDSTYRTVARQLRTKYKSGRVVVRIGWEANGSWMPFRTTYAKSPEYRAAFRRIAKVIKKEHPKAIIDFDINCGTALPGQRNRLDSLTRLYPGDDVVDLIGCDTYDWDVLKARTESQWRRALRPSNSVGIQDVADFARKRRKGLSFPEWGLTHAYDGNGDNPFYVRKMHAFFRANSDVLVLENYFNVPDKHMKNSLWNVRPQNPRAGAEYRRLW